MRSGHPCVPSLNCGGADADGEAVRPPFPLLEFLPMSLACRTLLLLLFLAGGPLAAAADVRSVLADGTVSHVEGSFADAFTAG